ncbi:DUF2332 domain-containing protein [Nocardiopsis algeriensis]|uniref:DUF2332 domain-containing protein n=1 Tax=Nocardiopsis algeriensis TaxID=1478215 RepID=UPI003B43C961
MEHVAEDGAGVDEVARWWRRFADQYAQGDAPAYARIARALAEDGQVLARMMELPAGNKRQPNLVLGAVRFLDGPVQEWPAFREFVLGNWERVRAVVLERWTQTNEVRRCATLLPVLGMVEGPLALLEVGASAGLCLYPDRYRYVFDGRHEVGPADSPVVLECATSGGAPLPERVPQVVWRAGVDLHPLDAGDERDVRWLESLIWPGPHEDERRERLRRAARVAAAEPAHMVAGDLVECLEQVAARAPEGATLVVFHSAALAYVGAAGRDEFVRAVRALPGHWISNEGWRVFPDQEGARPRDDGDFTVSLDGRVVGFAGPHGQYLHWAGGR